ncbi:TIGR03032 family protein [Parasphingopyxis sp.]|uniref:TIGR03032 family protein n=1 Tax=Parasphingopyxis sp. TaxID=1920299 RepID=UPI00261C89D3|nr:TIGR03032 family protein [Parasphingopyxis sp.]
MNKAKQTEEKFALTSSRHFPQWLTQQQISIVFTTYQGNKVYFIGVQPEGRLSIFERTFMRSMGIAVTDDARTLALATQYQIYRLDNVLATGQQTPDGFDALYGPHQSWITGDVDAHDVSFAQDGRPVFVATRFSCIATVSDGHSFRPLWKPPFISKISPEDRCHLNGMAMIEGKPAFATAISRSDMADGWRDKRADGGIVIDVNTNEIVAAELSMPHSPRMYRGELYLLNSGTGEFGKIDRESGTFEPIAFCPGYARGLTIRNGFAIIGLSLSRDNRTFSGLPLDQALLDRETEPRCGLAIVDLATGDMIHWVRIEGVIRELFDVSALPGVRRPSAIGFKTDEVMHVISVEA